MECIFCGEDNTEYIYAVNEDLVAPACEWCLIEAFLAKNKPFIVLEEA